MHPIMVGMHALHLSSDMVKYYFCDGPSKQIELDLDQSYVFDYVLAEPKVMHS